MSRTLQRAAARITRVFSLPRKGGGSGWGSGGGAPGGGGAAGGGAGPAQPYDDVRGSAEYKRNVVRVFTERGLRTAAEAARAA